MACIKRLGAIRARAVDKAGWKACRCDIVAAREGVCVRVSMCRCVDVRVSMRGDVARGRGQSSRGVWRLQGTRANNGVMSRVLTSPHPCPPRGGGAVILNHLTHKGPASYLFFGTIANQMSPFSGPLALIDHLLLSPLGVSHLFVTWPSPLSLFGRSVDQPSQDGNTGGTDTQQRVCGIRLSSWVARGVNTRPSTWGLIIEMGHRN